MTPRSIIAILASSLIFCAPLQALTFLPGTTLDTGDFFFDAEVEETDTAFFGPLLASASRTVTERRDGFDGFDVIPDLYIVNANIAVDVYAGAIGTVFAYRFGAVDLSGAGDNGVPIYTISGFAGLNIVAGWNFAGDPAIPALSRSADGDMIIIDFFDPLTTLQPTETILFATDAPSFRFNGSGAAALEIDTFGTTVRTFERLPAPAPIPLPASGLLLGGALGMIMLARRKLYRAVDG